MGGEVRGGVDGQARRHDRHTRSPLQGTAPVRRGCGWNNGGKPPAADRSCPSPLAFPELKNSESMRPDPGARLALPPAHGRGCPVGRAGRAELRLGGLPPLLFCLHPAPARPHGPPTGTDTQSIRSDKRPGATGVRSQRLTGLSLGPSRAGRWGVPGWGRVLPRERGSWPPEGVPGSRPRAWPGRGRVSENPSGELF